MLVGSGSVAAAACSEGSGVARGVVGPGGQPADREFAALIARHPEHEVRAAVKALLRGLGVPSVVGAIEVAWLPADDGDRGVIVIRLGSSDTGFKIETEVEPLTDNQVVEIGDLSAGLAHPWPEVLVSSSEVWALLNCRVRTVRIKRV